MDRVEAVLLAVRLAADEQRLLRDPVGSVRLLRVALPESVFLEGHGRVLGIRADGAGDHELSDLVDAALLEHVRAHDEVRVPVAPGVGPVRSDAADLGGQVEDEVGLRILEETRGRLHRGQVVIVASRCNDVVAVALEPLGEVRSEEPAAARDEDPHRSSASLER